MADDAAYPRTVFVNARKVARTPNRLAAIALVCILPAPNPATITVPTTQYTWSVPTPAVQIGGNQTVTVPTVSYTWNTTAPAVTSSSAPPDYLYSYCVSRPDARRLQPSQNRKNAGALAALFPTATSTIVTVPTVQYAWTPGPLNAIGDHAFLYLGSDDGRWPAPPVLTPRAHPERLLLIESQNVRIDVPTVQYAFLPVLPAVQLSGSQTVTVPTVQYAWSPGAPALPVSVTVPTVAYVWTPLAPSVNGADLFASVRVRAYRIGYYDLRIRLTGEVFTINLPNQYSPYWMAFVDTPPTNWTGLLDVFVLDTDLKRIRPLENAEVAALIKDPSGPYRRRR